MNKKTILSILCLLSMALTGHSSDYYVAPTGNDAAAGTRFAPFQTIQKAADMVRAGDKVFIKEGRYRETVVLKNSGSEGRPIRFIAWQGGKVVIDGTDPVPGPWRRHKGAIWKTTLDRPQVQQLFVGDVMQHEARWPDMPFEKRWDRDSWAKVDKTSEYGKIKAPGLAETNVDWTGGIAMLNIGHQFFTWTRDIETHGKGSDTFTYEKDLPGLAFLDPKTGSKKKTPWILKQWSDDYFYLFGKLEGLTVPTEWFHDPQKKVLYYMPEGNSAPEGVTVKTRDYGIVAKDINHLELQGLTLFGCAFDFRKCNHIKLYDCHVLYPSFRRRIMAVEQEKHKAPYPIARLNGNYNRIEKCSFQYSGGTALSIAGNSNVLENSIVQDGAWSGTLHYSLMGVYGKDNLIRRNTVSLSGAPLLHHKGVNIIELNHIYNGGLLSEDVSGVYTQGAPDGEGCRGTIVRYNWVHGVRTGHDMGQGIRGDDMTRGLIVHHNVIWDCGMTGIVVKGGENQIFNNTIFGVSNGKSKRPWINAGLIIPTQPEPRKPWKPYHKLNIYLDVQNSNSIISNNMIDDIYWRKEKIEAPGIRSNVEIRDKIGDVLVDPDNFDFRLKPSVVGTLPKATQVKTPEGAKSAGDYIGAYDPSKPAWKPGADWSL